MSKGSERPACPHCGAALPGIGTYCWNCKRYTDEPDKRADKMSGPSVPDTRKERDIRVAIKGVLRDLGFGVWDTEQERPTRVDAGIADLYVAGHGVTAWIEIKRAEGKQTEAQRDFAALVEANGGKYYLMRSEAEAVAWAREVMAPEEREL